MKIRRHGNKILHDSFETELQIGEFSEGLTKEAKNEFIQDHNLGIELARIYRDLRTNLHITNVLDGLREMEKEFSNYKG